MVTTALEPLTMTVIIDYQNIHLTARDEFAPSGVPPEACLVHPLLFAERVLTKRQNRLNMRAVATGPPAAPPTKLASVVVHRGQPSNKEQPFLYSVTQAQRSEWTRDRRVEVNYRPLRYAFEQGHQVVREKGVDVLVALALVRAASTKRSDIVVLATHDTDLEPAIEAAQSWSEGVSVETAGWVNRRVLLRGRGVRHTALDGTDFVASRDRRVYASRPGS